MFEAALAKLNMQSILVSAVPEASAVGESQSNGLSERVVQLMEDLVRTYKLVLEDRMGNILSTAHPLFTWMLEHAASTMSAYALHCNGRTGWGLVHGREARERVAELCERCSAMCPKHGPG